MQPVPGGNLVGGSGVELKVTFKDGGAPQFQGMFETVKERLQQVVDVARERNAGQAGAGAGVDMSNVHLDQLPSYQEHGQDRVARDEGEGDDDQNERVEVPRSATAEEVRAMAAAAATRREAESRRRRSREEEEAVGMPDDAPPGYEETQQKSVEDELSRRLERS